jgi:hypothetical protein
MAGKCSQHPFLLDDLLVRPCTNQTCDRTLTFYADLANGIEQVKETSSDRAQSEALNETSSAKAVHSVRQLTPYRRFDLHSYVSLLSEQRKRQEIRWLPFRGFDRLYASSVSCCQHRVEDRYAHFP